MRHAFDFYRCRGGDLNVWLVFAMICGGRPMKESVFYPSQAGLVPVTHSIWYATKHLQRESLHEEADLERPIFLKRWKQAKCG